MTEYQRGRVHLQTLSHSRTSTRRDCDAKYGYRYVDGLRPKIERDPTRIRGRGMHEGLRAGYEAWREGRAMIMSGGSAGYVDVAIPIIVETALAAELEAHTTELEALETARESGADISTVDEVRAELIDGHEADSWALRHFFEITAARDFERKMPVLIEYPFKVHVRDAVGRALFLWWIGVFDLVMYDEATRMLELHESKTVGTNAGSEEHRRRIEGDPQTTSYIYALRELQKGEPILFGPYANAPIGTVLVDVIRRKKPAEPKTLADGTISVDSRIDTLPEVYEAALEGQEEPIGLTKAENDCHDVQDAYSAEQDAKKSVRLGVRLEKIREKVEKRVATWGATKAKQYDLLEQLRQRGDTFLAQIEHHVGDRELERWRAEQWIEAERMRRIERRPAERTRNLGYCTAPGRGCSYRTLCYSGGDEQIREMEFTTPMERERMAAEAEAKALTEAPKQEAASGWG
jgi:hypothetical protein